MERYEVHLQVTTFLAVEVEADTDDEARALGKNAWAEESDAYKDATVIDEECSVLRVLVNP